MEVVVVDGAFLYAIGGLDMSIGSIMAFAAMIITLLFNEPPQLVRTAQKRPVVGKIKI